MKKVYILLTLCLMMSSMLFATEITQEQYQPAGRPSILWDFETGWQGWTHTSGLTFPAAWDVHTTTYPGGFYFDYLPPPDAGDSAFIIDSDSAGFGALVHDTAMSPVVANPGYTTLKWGYYIEYDDVWVLLRQYDGGWGPWNIVASYSGDTGPAWDSVDVTSYTGDSLQVGFRYDDFGAWTYGATFDNVEFYVPDYNDVGPISIDIMSPLPWNTTLPPEATVKNLGDVMETFDVTCDIAPDGYTSTENVVDLAPGDSVQVTFTPDFIFATGSYDVTVYTELPGDMDTSNDTMMTTIDTYDPGIAEGGSVTPASFSFGLKSNPAKDMALFNLALPEAGTITLRIYDITGRLVDDLVSGRKSAGHYEIPWTKDVSSGIFFYHLDSPWQQKIGKLVLLK